MTSLESEANNRRNGMVFTFYWKGFHNVPRYIINEYTGGPRLVRHLCQKLLKNRTIVNLGQAHTKFRTNQGH